MTTLECYIGQVLVGTGLANAGRYVTVLQVGKTHGRIFVERHLDGKKIWTFNTHYREVQP